MPRTLSYLNCFTEPCDSGDNKLYNVLKAYGNHDEEVGYCQGMSELFILRDEFHCRHDSDRNFGSRRSILGVPVIHVKENSSMEANIPLAHSKTHGDAGKPWKDHTTQTPKSI